MVFFGEIHVYLNLSLIGLVGVNRACIHLESSELQVDFLEKLTQFSLGNNVPDAPASNTDGFLLRYRCIPST
jgi:hypothetical protein